jgi:hypothetical protein
MVQLEPSSGKELTNRTQNMEHFYSYMNLLSNNNSLSRYGYGGNFCEMLHFVLLTVSSICTLI